MVAMRAWGRSACGVGALRARVSRVPRARGSHYVRAWARLRVRVLYRRFWQEVARVKGWPDRDLVVLERLIEAR